MSWGIEIHQSNGRVFATPDTPFMHMTKKVHFAIAKPSMGNNAININLGIPDSQRVVVYVRLDRAVAFTADPIVVNKVWQMHTNAANVCNGDFYVFTNSIPAGDGHWGLEMYNASGVRVFSTSTKPLQNMQTTLQWDPIHGTGTKARTIANAAVIPQPSQYWVQPINGGQAVQFFVGTSIAYGNQVAMMPMGTGVMPPEDGFSFYAFGGAVNYINTALY